MESENETVAEIIGEMREMPKDWIVDANANFVFVKYADRIEAAHRREVAALNEVISQSPCGEIYQLGLVDDEGNDYCGCAVEFSEQENEKMPRVGCGDRFVVVPFERWRKVMEGAAK